MWQAKQKTMWQGKQKTMWQGNQKTMWQGKQKTMWPFHFSFWQSPSLLPADQNQFCKFARTEERPNYRWLAHSSAQTLSSQF
jgi:hypothetical protein